MVTLSGLFSKSCLSGAVLGLLGLGPVAALWPPSPLLAGFFPGPAPSPRNYAVLSDKTRSNALPKQRAAPSCFMTALPTFWQTAGDLSGIAMCRCRAGTVPEPVPCGWSRAGTSLVLFHRIAIGNNVFGSAPDLKGGAGRRGPGWAGTRCGARHGPRAHGSSRVYHKQGEKNKRSNKQPTQWR